LFEKFLDAVRPSDAIQNFSDRFFVVFRLRRLRPTAVPAGPAGQQLDGDEFEVSDPVVAAAAPEAARVHRNDVDDVATLKGRSGFTTGKSNRGGRLNTRLFNDDFLIKRYDEILFGISDLLI